MDSLVWKSPIGRLKICAEDGRITGLCLPQGATDPAPALDNVQHSALLNEACRQLDEYFRGRRRAFDLPIGGAGTAFQQRVWAQLRPDPMGKHEAMRISPPLSATLWRSVLWGRPTIKIPF